MLDPELGALLSGPRLEEARRVLTVPVAKIGVGEWDISGLRAIRSGALGLLIVDGVLAAETVLDGQVSIELVGDGDLLRPWPTVEQTELDGPPARLNALSHVTLAVLDQPGSAALSRFPEVQAILMERLHARLRRLATLHAISQQNRVDDRLRMLFRQLARRWGRVGVDGVIIPLALSHRQLGEIIGARRPTVSTALGQLAERHELTRRDDGTWLFHGVIDAATRGASPPEAIRQRRRFTPAPRPPDDADAAPALPEFQRTLSELRESALANGARLQQLREQSAALQERSRTLRASPAGQPRGLTGGRRVAPGTRRVGTPDGAPAAAAGNSASHPLDIRPPSNGRPPSAAPTSALEPSA